MGPPQLGAALAQRRWWLFPAAAALLGFLTAAWLDGLVRAASAPALPGLQDLTPPPDRTLAVQDDAVAVVPPTAKRPSRKLKRDRPLAAAASGSGGGASAPLSPPALAEALAALERRQAAALHAASAANDSSLYNPADFLLPRQAYAVPAYPPRTPDVVEERVRFAHSCMSAHKGVGEMPPAPPPAITTDRLLLRAHAFEVYAALAPLRAEPVAAWAGYPGPWIENHWLAMAQPVKKWVPLSEVRDFLNTWGDDGDALEGSDDESELLAAVAEALSGGIEGVGNPYPLPGNASEREVNGTHILIEEPFDYELFHPWVPLFVQWEDAVINSGFSWSRMSEIAASLRPLLRPDVQYVTVTQRFSGLFVELEWRLNMREACRNVLVLAAGGGGHVPLPLLKQPELPVTDPAVAQPPDADPAALPYALSFLGETKHHPVRELMQNLTAASRVPHKWGKEEATATTGAGSVPPWVATMHASAFSLAPRGVGPTSFRLYEALQLGLIPVVVWDDYAWLPYHPGAYAFSGVYKKASALALEATPPSLWDEIAVVLHVSQYAEWLAADLPQLLADKGLWRRKKAAVTRYRSLFTFGGVVSEIGRFLADPLAQRQVSASGDTAAGLAGGVSPGTLLRCVPKPSILMRKPPKTA